MITGRHSYSFILIKKTPILDLTLSSNFSFIAFKNTTPNTVPHQILDHYYTEHFSAYQSECNPESMIEFGTTLDTIQ